MDKTSYTYNICFIIGKIYIYIYSLLSSIPMYMRYSGQIDHGKAYFCTNIKERAKTYLMLVFIQMCQPNSNKKPLQTKQNIDKYMFYEY